ncbi:hypothetical protein F5Y15DRAFT_399789 [Xylariaceae sp. FL0016]|nr:hypothetical protein F5Y15DRAFT_399789 [Xylariaceae sp. FL0016]
MVWRDWVCAELWLAISWRVVLLATHVMMMMMMREFWIDCQRLSPSIFLERKPGDCCQKNHSSSRPHPLCPRPRY